MVAIERFYSYIKEKGLKPTPLERDLGLSNGYIGKMLKRKSSIGSDVLEKIVYHFPDLNPNWLLSGKGEMIIKTKSTENVTNLSEEGKTKSTENVTFKKGDKKGDILRKNEKYKKSYPFREGEGTHLVEDRVQDFRLRTDSNWASQVVPLYNIEASAGLVPLFNDQARAKPLNYISIPNLPRCDGAIYVTGDSMYPLLKSGDIVLYKQIEDFENNIFWGEMYLISINVEGEEYVTVKYIQRSDKQDHIKLVSHNQHHSDKEVHISKVMAVAFVKASVRINSIN